MGLLRAAAQVGSLALNTLRTQPVNLLGGPSFDEMFDEPTQSFWADEQPLIEPEPVVAKPDLESLATQFFEALDSGDFERIGRAAVPLSDAILAETLDIARSVFPLPPSSAAGEASPDTGGPSVEESPVSGLPTAGAGHPNLTGDDLMDAAAAARFRAKHCGLVAGSQSWVGLADRLEEAAVAALK